MKKPLKDSFIIGFALFSMFFGAGNVIFPPYLGLESGPHWLLGFISYYIADIGLALLAMFAILRQGKGHLPHWEGPVRAANVRHRAVHRSHAGHSPDRRHHL